MKPFRLSVITLLLAETAVLAAFFWQGESQQIVIRAHFAALEPALQANAASQNLLPSDLRRRADGCVPPSEVDFFGKKRTEPDYEEQLECERRILYGDFIDSTYSWQLVRYWLELPYWMLLAGLATLAVTYGTVFGVHLARDKG
jgi:hypothetical protein